MKMKCPLCEHTQHSEFPGTCAECGGRLVTISSYLCVLCLRPAEMNSGGRDTMTLKNKVGRGTVCYSCARENPQGVCECEECQSNLWCTVFGRDYNEFLVRFAKGGPDELWKNQ
jgi:hypothetical protein